MSKNYVVPVLLTITAESYQEALERASKVEFHLHNNSPELQGDIGFETEVATYFEHDNIGQRVLYLHPEEDPDYEHVKDEDEEDDGPPTEPEQRGYPNYAPFGVNDPQQGGGR